MFGLSRSIRTCELVPQHPFTASVKISDPKVHHAASSLSSRRDIYNTCLSSSLKDSFDSVQRQVEPLNSLPLDGHRERINLWIYLVLLNQQRNEGDSGTDT